MKLGLPSTVLAGTPADVNGRRYTVAIAHDEAILAAQKLRHQVFVEEMAALPTMADGVEADPLDEHCDHLAVRDEATGDIVGTYRLLSPQRATDAGRLFCDEDFDLSPLAELRADMVEAGRACVHPDHRNGAVISLMWAGIARYMQLTGHRWLAGVVTIPAADGGRNAAAIWDVVSAKHLAPPRYLVRPHKPWDPSAIERPARREMYPLLQGYLRLGAWICGTPADMDRYRLVGMFALLSLDRANPRYLRYFLGESG